MPAGRPSKYKPEYCIQLIDHMRQGGSFEAFCAVTDSDVRQLYRWATRYPAFRQAQELGEKLGRKFWEDLGKQGLAGQIKTKTSHYEYKDQIGKDGKITRVKVLVKETEHPASFNASAWIFMMKNRYGWRDQVDQKIVHSGSIQTQVIMLPSNGRELPPKKD